MQYGDTVTLSALVPSICKPPTEIHEKTNGDVSFFAEFMHFNPVLEINILLYLQLALKGRNCYFTKWHIRPFNTKPIRYSCAVALKRVSLVNVRVSIADL